MMEREEPLVAAVCAVPLLGEALADALAGLAEIKVIPARQADVAGLLESLQPDAIVVDDEDEAEIAAEYSRFARVPVIHVSLREQKLRLLEDGRWKDADGFDASPEAIRNLVAGGIYGRKAPR